MAVRSDVRLLDAPMQELGCGQCPASVLVRKATWEQTSIQWSSKALSACQERDEFERTGGDISQFPGCESLGDSIRAASIEGRIDVIHRDEEDNGK